MTATLADAYDARLYARARARARARHEAVPTGALFTAPPTPRADHGRTAAPELRAAGVGHQLPHQAGPTAPNPTKIRALTIQPPWSDLIALTGEEIAKRIENRVWNWLMSSSTDGCGV